MMVAQVGGPFYLPAFHFQHLSHEGVNPARDNGRQNALLSLLPLLLLFLTYMTFISLEQLQLWIKRYLFSSRAGQHVDIGREI